MIPGGGTGVIFKPLSREEFDHLSVEEQMDYLKRLMADLRQKMEETRTLSEKMRQNPGQNPE
jgi:hypothetical protein